MPDAKPFSIVLIEDNASVGEALHRWFSNAQGVQWLGWTTRGAEALDLIARRPPDLVALDVDLPGEDSFKILRDIAQRFPDVKVVMFSGHARPADVTRALDDGAAGYIVKDDPLDAILGLLRRAAAGECVLSTTAAKSYLRTPTSPRV